MPEASASKRGLPMRVKMRHSSHFVDELASRHETPVGRLLPLSAIQTNPEQPRRELGELADLVASIREKGVLEPILVRRHPSGGSPTGQATFLIVAGERRYRAALEAGLFEIPAIELELSEQEALEVALIENLQRKDLNPFEEAEGYSALAELHGYTQEEIAKTVGKARSSVAESLTLLEIPEELRSAALALGVMAKSALLEVAKLRDAEKMRLVLERAARQGLNRDDLRDAARAGSSSGGTRGAKGSRSGRGKPYLFKFRAPDRSFQVQLSFRQQTVDRADLIRALEQILAEIRAAEE